MNVYIALQNPQELHSFPWLPTKKTLLHYTSFNPVLVSRTNLYLHWEELRNSGLISRISFHTCLAAILALNLAPCSCNWVSPLLPGWSPHLLGLNLHLSLWNELSLLRDVLSSSLFSLLWWWRAVVSCSSCTQGRTFLKSPACLLLRLSNISTASVLIPCVTPPTGSPIPSFLQPWWLDSDPPMCKFTFSDSQMLR